MKITKEIIRLPLVFGDGLKDVLIVFKLLFVVLPKVGSGGSEADVGGGGLVAQILRVDELLSIDGVVGYKDIVFNHGLELQHGIKSSLVQDIATLRVSDQDLLELDHDSVVVDREGSIGGGSKSSEFRRFRRGINSSWV